MKEKQVKMSLELAKQMLGKDEAMDMLIKKNFNDEELGIKPELPKTWEDVGNVIGWYISPDGNVEKTISLNSKDCRSIGIYPTKQLAEAARALSQLIYLRDIYNDWWQPDWKDGKQNYIIASRSNEIECFENNTVSHPMAFKTSGIRDLFFENFKDLLEIAKPLL